MSRRQQGPESVELPWLPEGRTLVLPGRGEVYYRRHHHPDPAAPTLLLLHGWTASADLQFFAAYQALADHWSFIAIDHRGHGRGLRSNEPFQLEDAADDAAALVRALGVQRVVTVGYSMGGPISMLVAKRHPELVAGVVVQATALEWSGTYSERVQWRMLPMLGWLFRSSAFPRLLRWGVRREAKRSGGTHAEWAAAEYRRMDVRNILEAGRALRRYDARPWAKTLRLPAAMLITTRDQLVPPKKQHALADELGAHVIEIPHDHLCTVNAPDEYARSTVELVQHVMKSV